MKHCTHISAAILMSISLAWCAYGDPESQAYRIHGPFSSGSHFGNKVSAAGDVNNDGIDDYMVGAFATSLAKGAVLIYSGSNGQLIRALHGNLDYGCFGLACAGIGDINNDGYDEIIVGQPTVIVNESTLHGFARIFSGQTGGQIRVVQSLQNADATGLGVAGLGDVDGDAVPDYAVASPSFDSGISNVGLVRVFSGATGNVLASFAGNSFNANLGVTLVAMGDLNGDGFADMAASEPGSNCVRVLSPRTMTLLYSLTNGLPASSFGESIANAGDCTGDGVNDILVGAPDAGRVYLYNGADGALIRTFSGPNGSDLGRAVAGIGDFNGDGATDIALAAHTYAGLSRGRIEIRRGTDGAFITAFSGSPQYQAFPTSLVGISDVNGDGGPDFLAGHQEAVTAYVYTWNEPVFDFVPTAVSAGPSTPTFIFSSDVTSDGIADIISLNESTVGLRVYINQGGTLASPKILATATGASSGTATDFDGDHRRDIAVTLPGFNRIGLYRGTSVGPTANSTIPVGRKPSFVVTSDLNRDGKMDLVVTERADKTVSVLLNSGSSSSSLAGRFKPRVSYSVGGAPIQVTCRRMNLDTHDDLVVLNQGTRTISVLRNRGDGRFRPQRITSLPMIPVAMVVHDFNRDGINDVAVACKDTQNVLVYTGLGTGYFSEPVMISAGAEPRAVSAIDFNRDGYVDLVTANLNNTASIMLANSSGGFETPMQLTVGTDPAWLTVCDLDCDTDVDILTINRGSNNMTLLKNTLIE